MSGVRLFHVSEEPNIARFEPRPPPGGDDMPVVWPVVWAIDEAHLANYLLPRDCPRVTYAAGAMTTKDDIEGFFDGSAATRILVIEQDWMPRILDAALHVYDMPPQSFALIDKSAGYYVSRHAVEPLGMRTVRNPVGEILERGCEIRAVPDLHPIRDNVAASSLDYSIIRMRNARRPL